MGKIVSLLSKLPWPIRVLLALGMMYLVLCIAVWRMVEDLTDTASEIMDIEYGDSYFNWRGHFGVNDVAVTLYDNQGEVRAEYEMDRVVIRPSSPLWLLRNSFFSPSKYLPDEIGVTLEGLRNKASNDTTPGNYTNLPYDAMGCTDFLLTPRQIQAMGLKELRRDVHLQIDRQSTQSVNVGYAFETVGVGKLAVDAVVDMEWPVRTRNIIAELDEAPLRSASLTFTDQGFIGVRNASCAKQHGMDANAFHAYHMQEVRRRLSEENLSYGEAALQQYEAFANKGEQLVIRSAGAADVTFGEFMGMSTFQKLQVFPLQIAASGANPSTMQVVWGGPGPKSRTADSAAAMVQAAVDESAAPAPAAQPVSAELPMAGAEVTYQQAAALVGQHIDVSTRLGTHRRGILRAHLPQVLTLELDRSEGGFSLTIYADDVAGIRYSPLASEPN